MTTFDKTMQEFDELMMKLSQCEMDAENIMLDAQKPVPEELEKRLARIVSDAQLLYRDFDNFLDDLEEEMER